MTGKQLIAVILLTVLFSLGFISYTQLTREKTGWVNIEEIYSEFKLKKELEKKLELFRSGNKRVMDSLEFEIILQSRNSEIDSEIEGKKQVYLKNKHFYEKEEQIMSSRFQEQIITQINQYVKDFGEANKYQYILGADGTGSLMYADQKRNLTEQIKTYINERYDGGKK